MIPFKTDITTRIQTIRIRTKALGLPCSVQLKIGQALILANSFEEDKPNTLSSECAAYVRQIYSLEEKQ